MWNWLTHNTLTNYGRIFYGTEKTDKRPFPLQQNQTDQQKPRTVKITKSIKLRQNA